MCALLSSRWSITVSVHRRALSLFVLKFNLNVLETVLFDKIICTKVMQCASVSLCRFLSHGVMLSVI